MSLTADELALLDAVADDWYGLWEVDWWFNGVQPGWSFDRRLTFLSDLVRRGLIEVFFGRLGVKSPALEESEALDAICKPAAWLPRAKISNPVYHVSTSVNGCATLPRP